MCDANSAQTRAIRKKMVEIMTGEVNKVQLRDLVKKLIPESIGKQIEKETQGIFPLKDVHIKKVKILKKPKFDITKLLESHGDNNAPAVTSEDAGAEVAVADPSQPAARGGRPPRHRARRPGPRARLL